MLLPPIVRSAATGRNLRTVGALLSVCGLTAATLAAAPDYRAPMQVAPVSAQPAPAAAARPVLPRIPPHLARASTDQARLQLPFAGHSTAAVTAAWSQARLRHPSGPTYAGTPDRHIDCLHLKCIALTFDDGPGPETTDGLLEILAREHVRATFMVVGRNVAEDPGPTIRAAWDGHEIGIHTWDHQALPGRSLADIAADITRTSAEITRYTGVVPSVVRPPYGAIDVPTARLIPYPLILWSVDPDDWRDQNSDLVYRRVTEAGRPGSIVLMHDIYPTTVGAVPRIIDFYKQQHYTFVTVSELYESKLRAHQMYHGRMADVARARAKDKAAHRHRKAWVDPELRTAPAPAPVAPADQGEPAEQGTPVEPPADDTGTVTATSPPDDTVATAPPSPPPDDPAPGEDGLSERPPYPPPAQSHHAPADRPDSAS
ncbi:MAG TPA: polysaccharide deacetylase family protein [Sporichthyaceae bacterium]|nr:polysaccharide deacetylase family protein [Sporichthyaceae bacterium]